MRRAAALLLLALFSLSLAEPVVSAAADSKLPACCRRGGAHRCTMGPEGGSSGPALESVKCPFYPVGQAVRPAPTGGEAYTGSFFSAPLIGHSAVSAKAQIQCHLSFSRAGQKRGPPSLL